MKRLISATKGLIAGTLALSLIGATAATAAPAYYGTPVQYRSDNYRHRGDDGNNAALAAGIGFIALAAILASQNNHRDYGRDDWNRRGYEQGYGRDYGQDYGRGYGYGNSTGGYERGSGNSYGNYDRGYDRRGW
jgi:hypothetical protein